MSDPDAPSNVPEFSVSELSGALKRTVEGAFPRVRVRGEISQPKVAGSGHCYLRLKDDTAVIDGIVWRNAMARLEIRPEEGLEVIATGRLTTYPGRSSYQIVIETMSLAGEGALLKMLEERRRRLAAEGLFDVERKRRPPFLPAVIGVVTSPTGAVIRDILHRIADRFPRTVLLWPVAVQGQGAAEQVAAAIAGFNALTPAGPVPRPDVLIVARGGGSLDDLMAFNEEAVVRAAAGSAIPLISAVGHETDTTLIDLAADLRAPTPTGAAEMAVPVRLDLAARLHTLAGRLDGAILRGIDERRMRVEGLGRGLPDLSRLVDEATQRLDDRAERLAAAPMRLLDHRATALAQTAARLRSPRDTLDLRAADLARAGQALHSLGRRHLDEAGRALAQVTGRLRPDRIAAQADGGIRALTALSDRLDLAAERGLKEQDKAIDVLHQRLESVSYLGVLKRGYAVLRDAGGRVVSDAAGLGAGKSLAVELRDGTVAVTVGDGSAPAAESPPADPEQPPAGPGSATAAKPAKASRSRRLDKRQGDLLDGL